MKLLRFISTGDPVTIKACGQTFTVRDGEPYEVALSKIDYELHPRHHGPPGSTRRAATDAAPTCTHPHRAAQPRPLATDQRR